MNRKFLGRWRNSKGSLSLESILVIALLALSATATLLLLGDTIACLFMQESGTVNRLSFYVQQPTVQVASSPTASDGSVTWDTQGTVGPYQVLRYRPGTSGETTADVSTWAVLGTFSDSPATGIDVQTGDYVAITADSTRCRNKLLSKIWGMPNDNAPSGPTVYVAETVAKNASDSERRWLTGFDSSFSAVWQVPLSVDDSPAKAWGIALASNAAYVGLESADPGSTFVGTGVYVNPADGNGGFEPLVSSVLPALMPDGSTDENRSIDTAGGLAVSSNGTWLLARDTAGGVLVIDPTGNAQTRYVDTVAYGFTFGLDGRAYVLVDGGNWRVMALDTATGELTQAIDIPDAAVAAMNLAGGEVRLQAVGSDGTAYFHAVTGSGPAFSVAADGTLASSTPSTGSLLTLMGEDTVFTQDGHAAYLRYKDPGDMPGVAAYADGSWVKSPLWQSSDTDYPTEVGTDDLAGLEGSHAGGSSTDPPSGPGYTYQLLVNGKVVFSRQFTPKVGTDVNFNDISAAVSDEQAARYAVPNADKAASLPATMVMPVIRTDNSFFAVAGSSADPRSSSTVWSPGGPAAETAGVIAPTITGYSGGITDYYASGSVSGESYLTNAWPTTGATHQPPRTATEWGKSVNGANGHVTVLGKKPSSPAYELCTMLREDHQADANMTGSFARNWWLTGGSAIATAGVTDPDVALILSAPLANASDWPAAAPSAIGDLPLANLSSEMVGVNWTNEDGSAGTIDNFTLQYGNSDTPGGYPSVSAANRGRILASDGSVVSSVPRFQTKGVKVEVRVTGGVVKPALRYSAGSAPQAIAMLGATASGSVYGVRNDGTVLVEGGSPWIARSWTNIAAVAAGDSAAGVVGLRKDGTVVTASGTSPADSWTGITAVSSSAGHVVGLRSNGTVVATGDNTYGQLNVGSWTNIKAIYAGNGFTVGVRDDGSVVAVGQDTGGQLSKARTWTNVVSVSGGGAGDIVAVREDGTLLSAYDWGVSWNGLSAVQSKGFFVLGLRSTGQLEFTGNGGMYDAGGIIAYPGRAKAITAGQRVAVALYTDGTVRAAGGDNPENTEVINHWYVPSDHTAPSAPTVGYQQWLTEPRVSFYLNNVTDNASVISRFEVWRDGEFLSYLEAPDSYYIGGHITAGVGQFSPFSLNAQPFTDTVGDNSTHTYRFRAQDSNGNWGGWSDDYPVVTNIAPSKTTGLILTPRTSDNEPAAELAGFRATQGRPGLDNQDVAGFQVERDGSVVATVPAGTPVDTGYQRYVPGRTYLDKHLSSGIAYAYRVRAYDSHGNYGPWSDTATITLPAFVAAAPGKTTGLAAQAQDSVSVTLNGFTAPAGDYPVTGWQVERDGSAVATLAANATFYNDNNLTPSTTYAYRVRAFDGHGNYGDWSDVASATTAAGDTDAPSKVTGLVATPWSSTQWVNLSGYSATDNAAVTDYEVSRSSDGGDTWTAVGTVQTTDGYIDTTTDYGTTYLYRMRASDAAGNKGAWSDSVSVDTESPVSQVTNLVASPWLTQAAVSLSFSPAGAVGDTIAGYDVERDGVVVASTSDNYPGYDDAGLAAGTTYTYRVRGFDTAGHRGPWSGSVTVETAAADTTPPSQVSGLVATPWSSGPYVSLSGYTASDDFGVTGYEVERNGTVVASTADGTYLDGPLTAGSYYDYRVRARDAAGNWGTWSFYATVQVPGGKPTNVAAVGSYRVVTLSWSPVAGANLYRVSRSATADMANAIIVASPAGAAASITPLANDTTYYFTVAASTDGGATFGDESDVASARTHAVPTQVTGVVAEASSDGHGVTLSGYTATDADGTIDHYRVRNITLDTYSNTTGPTYTETGLTPSTLYQYRVAAVDNDGHTGSWSTTVTVTTNAADTEAPGQVTGLTAQPWLSQFSYINLYGYSATDNSGVTAYEVERSSDGGSTWDALGTAPDTNGYIDLTPAPGTTYSYRMRAVDAAGNKGAWSDTVTATSWMPDTEAPSQATGLAASPWLTASSVTLSGYTATDNQAVTGYEVERDGVVVATATEATYVDAGLADDTTFTYRVRAVDAAGNKGEWSSAVTATTGSGNSTTVSLTSGTGDGYVRSFSSADYATAHNASAGNLVNVAATSFGAYTYYRAGSGYYVSRAFVPFDTSGVAGTVTSATLTITRTNADSGSYDASGLVLLAGTQGTPLAVGDFVGFGATELAPRVSMPMSAGTPVTFTLNAAGIAYLNSAGGNARFCVRTVTDMDNGTPPTTNGGPAFASSENTTATWRPTLSVTASSYTPPADSQAPSQATGLVGTPWLTQATVTLSGYTATDDRGIAGYDIERDGTIVGTASGSTYEDGGLADATAYAYRVRAYDAAGNRGPWSGSITATTRAIPTQVTGLAGSSNAEGTGVVLSGYTATDADSPIDHYRVHNATTDTYANTTDSTWTEAGLTPGNSYDYRVAAVDSEGNQGPWSATVSVLVEAGDSQAPSQVTGLAATAWTTQSYINLASYAATDNKAVAGYEVQRSTDGSTWADLGTAPNADGYIDTTCADDTTYWYRMRAADAAGNKGAWSDAVSAATGHFATAPMSVGSTAADGRVSGLSTVWSTARSTGTSVSTTSAVITVYSQLNASTYAVNRGFLFFDKTGVSGIASATVTVVKASTTTPYDSSGLALFAGTQSDPLTVADFNAFGATELAARVPSPAAAGDSATFVLNAAGIAYLNSAGNTAKFCVRAVSDVDNTIPSLRDGGTYGAAENTNASYRPVLTMNVPSSDYVPAAVADTTPPSQVTGLLATPWETQSWASISGYTATDDTAVTGYEIERSTDGFDWSAIGTVADTNGYTDTTTEGGTVYYYRLRAYDAAGNRGAWSDLAFLSTTDLTPPSQVTGLVATPWTTASSVTLSGYAATGGAVAYEVERDSVSLGETAAATFIDSGLADSTAFSYRVRARDAAGNWGAWSDPVVATTGHTATLSVTPTQDGRVYRTGQLSWTAARDTADGTAVNTINNLDTKSTATSGTSWNNFRSFYYFDTSAVPDAAAVTGATLRLTNVVASPTLLSTDMVLLAGQQGGTLAVGDYDAYGTTELAGRASFNPVTAGSVTTLTLNASGLSSLALAGTTQFCVMTAYDRDNVAPAGTVTYGGSIGSMENATAAWRPTLEISYYTN